MSDKIPSDLQFEEWLKKADDDELAVKAILKEKVATSIACFHAQQMAEKYLKAFLVAKRKWYPKIHHLDKLLELCMKIDPSFKDLTDDSIYLTAFYIPVRYPGEYPEFTISEAKDALSTAQRIKDFVLDKIKK